MLKIPEMGELTRIIDLVENGSLIIVNGGISVTKNIATGINNSIVSFGEGANNTVINNNNNGVSEDLLMKLFKEIDSSKLSNDEKNDLKELVEAAQAESSADEPKKTIIRSMLDSARGIINTVNSSPTLIDTYTKWAQFIQNPPTL